MQIVVNPPRQNAASAILMPDCGTARAAPSPSTGASAAIRASSPQSSAPTRIWTRPVSASIFLAWFGIAFMGAFGLVWIYVASMPMAFLSRDYPLAIAKRTLIDECRSESVAVFGDSRTLAATVPDDMPIPVTNLAQSGSSPIETFFAVRRLLRCATAPKAVVIAHGALKFSSDSDYWTSFVRNGFLDYADMREVDRDAASLHDTEIQDLLPSDQIKPTLREFLYSIRFPAFYFDSLIHGFVAARWQHNRNALRENLSSSGHSLFGTGSGSSEIAGEGPNSNFRASPLIDLYFSRTLEMLSERGVKVIFVSIPVNHATYAQMPARLSDSFGVYLRSKAAQFANLHVVGPTIPCWPDEFFGDAWHFNARGAELYSRALGVWLVKFLGDGETRAELPDLCTNASLASATSGPMLAER
jgi:hypothetical protein